MITAFNGVDDMNTAQNAITFSRSVLMESCPVELDGLCHRYGGADEAWTLKDINLQLKTGELVGLLGPSGCGKTTLLNIIDHDLRSFPLGSFDDSSHNSAN